MKPASNLRSARSIRLWIGVGTLFVSVILTTWLAPRHGATETGVLAAAMVGALATLAIAALYSGSTRYPRGAYWTSAGIVSAGMLISVFTARDPAFWAVHVRSTAWMYPWWFIVLGLYTPRTTGICATTSPWVGRLLIGTGLLFALILQLPSLLRL